MPAYCHWLSALARGLLAALLAIAAGLAVAADSGSVVEHAEVRQANGGYVADLVIWLPAPRELAFAVLIDFERMPEWVPNLRQTRVLERDANRVTVEHQGVVQYGILTVPFTTLREVGFVAPDRIHTLQIRGTMKRHESRMVFAEDRAGTRIDYHVEMEPSALAGLVMNEGRVESELRAHCEAIGAEILRRKDALPTVSK
ncbi:MAG: SRPBCC family protein [Burkholderiaceae bacterium]|jgi:ribosome-associated toxin RatA of RatAB toxin-antitoxin module|nr:SRPBCC family protein [Burkholderiaceae bacterium]